MATQMEDCIRRVGRQKPRYDVVKALAFLVAQMDLLVAIYVNIEEDREQHAFSVPAYGWADRYRSARALLSALRPLDANENNWETMRGTTPFRTFGDVCECSCHLTTIGELLIAFQL